MYEKDGPEKWKEISYKLKSFARLLTEFTKMGRETIFVNSAFL